MGGRGAVFCVLAAASALAAAGCSLFLVDGFTSDEPVVLVVQGGPEAGAEAGQALSPDAGPSGYAREVLADEPVAYFPLEETTGDKVRDVSGHGNDGVLVDATAAERVAGAGPTTGRAIRLTSPTGIELGNKLGFPGRVPCSFEAWARPDAGPSRGWRHVYSKLLVQSGPRSGTYLYFFDEAPGYIKLERWADGDAPQVAGVDGRMLPKDRFTHVVGVVNGTDLLLYLDGQLVNQSPIRGDAKDNAVPASFGLNFFGTLDELAIYDRALSSQRIKAHHDAGRAAP